MVICTDFDGTLCESKWPDIGKPNRVLMKYLINCRRQGIKVILWTMREGKLLDNAVEFCKLYGLEFDAINDNLQEQIQFYGNNPRKIYADWYIDDHNALGIGRKLPVLKRGRI